MFTIYRFRKNVLSLDSATSLTRGRSQGFLSLLSYLNPGSDVFTGIARRAEEDLTVVGQISFSPGERSARLSYLLPDHPSRDSAILDLLDGLSVQAGNWGASNLLVEVPEKNLLFEFLRQAGFVVYARQQIYKLSFDNEVSGGTEAVWNYAAPEDENEIRNLFNTLLPPIVLAAEPLPQNGLFGLVYYQENKLRAFVECVFGPAGIYLRPLIHPDVENLNELIKGLEYSLAPLLRRPVYLVVRSYQAWLESALHNRHPRAATRQALMVKRLALTQRVEQLNHNRKVIEETSQPLVNQALPDQNP